MIFKKKAKIETDDFWYDLTDGGYIDPFQILEEPYASQVKEAIELLTKFKEAAEDQRVIKYY